MTQRNSRLAGNTSPWIGWWMKAFFVAGHFVVPLICWLVVRRSICGCLELSWPMLVVLGVGLLPFILPLATAYLGKMGSVTSHTSEPWWAMIPGSPDKALLAPEKKLEQVGEVPNEAKGFAAPAENATEVGPNFDALTNDEKRVLRTLWTHQLQHTVGKGEGWWGFQVAESSPDYPSYLRGAGSLSERKLVTLVGGMVFLNEFGLRYCYLNIEKLKTVENYWKHFSPRSNG